MKNLYCPSFIKWFIYSLLLLLWHTFTYTNEDNFGEATHSRISRKNGSCVHCFRVLLEEGNTDMCNSYSTLMGSALQIISNHRDKAGKAVKISLDNEGFMHEFNHVLTDEKFPRQVSSFKKRGKHKQNLDVPAKGGKYASNVYNNKRMNDSYLDDYYDEYEKYEKEKYNHKYYDGRTPRPDERGNCKYQDGRGSRIYHQERYHEDRDDRRYPQDRDHCKYRDDDRYPQDRDEYKYRDGPGNHTYHQDRYNKDRGDCRYPENRDNCKYWDDDRYAKDRANCKYSDDDRYPQERDDRRYAHDQRGQKNKKYRDEYNKYDEYYKYDGKDNRDNQDDSYRKPSNYKQPAFDNEANKLPRTYPTQDSTPKPLNDKYTNFNKAGKTHDPMNLGDNAKKLHNTLKNHSDKSKGYYSKRYYGDNVEEKDKMVEPSKYHNKHRRCSSRTSIDINDDLRYYIDKGRQQCEFSGCRIIGILKNCALGKMFRQSDSKVELEKTRHMKNKAQDERREIKPSGFFNKLAYAIRKNKTFLKLVFMFSVPYPLVLYASVVVAHSVAELSSCIALFFILLIVFQIIIGFALSKFAVSTLQSK
ncbi:hypothetical protein AK88_03621 [Plasmodium fragile]|uniref:Pv-fam-d protein n=1 Tax=Plasmodium fragile TaxID=5857 RepID=A0A0D9QI55_PLAFR|nr:uncharacterized protein AK88_03621 [Plasmodium fragile]KJP86709.1 hypothetical protein AK88_03621 [Plasmodium fragile]